MSMPHDRPSAAEMVEAVREWIGTSFVSSDAPPNRFHARVAANMLAIVEREAALGPRHADEHRARLDLLGMTDDAELARAIREGALDGRAAEVRALVWESVKDKLAVANPAYLDRIEP